MDGESVEVYRQASRSLEEVKKSLTKCNLYLRDPAIKSVASEDIIRSLMISVQDLGRGVELCIENIPSMVSEVSPLPACQDGDQTT